MILTKVKVFQFTKELLNLKNNIIVTLDGDGQNNPVDIPFLLEKYYSDDKIFFSRRYTTRT